ncbi:MAG: saccharopine dehydrogenase NADP-binding domain-containing protein [Proteobacteria bacterium]|nr:saccharopine dehydrogenase NADP-binding domain-containing protein [Pseudomonadota bacterium]
MSKNKDKPIILILGGYGNFGSRIATVLAAQNQFKICIAGRSLEKASLLVSKIKQENPNADLQACLLDWQAETFTQNLLLSEANLVIHCAGPFQNQDYKVAHTCIDLGIHYFDLADAREFVTHIDQFDLKAKEKNVCIISGAGTVPALSCTIVDTFAKKFSILREIEIGISPANKIQLGDATITAILGYTGKPFWRLEEGQWKKTYGWQNLHRHYYGDNLGLRWQASCDIPDLALLPERYPSLTTAVFHAGLEVPSLHIILWFMSWIVRAKIVKNWALVHKLITQIQGWFEHFGTTSGGMYVRLKGSSTRYQPLEINWTLVAEQGHGNYIPIIASLILIKKIFNGQMIPGAQPCVDLFTLGEFENWFERWSIYTTLEEVET